MLLRYTLPARFLAVLLLLAPPFCGTGCSSSLPRTRPDSVSLAARTVEIPSEFIDDAIVVEVMINGTGPHRLLLDTGSAVSQVSPAVARAAGLRRIGSVSTIDAHGKTYREPLARVDRLEAGGLTARGVPFTIQDLPERIASGPRVVGVLGYNPFTASTLDLDYPAERVRVSSERLRRSDPGVTTLTARNDRVPFIEGVFRIPGESQAKFPSKMLVDSGSGAVLTLAGYDAILFPDRGTAVQVGASMSANGTIQPAVFARLNFDLHLGDVVATRLMALVEDTPRRVDSAIGAELLRRFRVRLDPVSGLARFEHPAGLTEVPMPVWRVHGFTVSLENPPLPVITQINPGSPAETGGLMVGDAIIAIDGRDLDETLEAWPGPTLDQEITHRLFVVRRAGETHTLRLELAEYLQEPFFHRLFREKAARDASLPDAEAEAEAGADGPSPGAHPIPASSIPAPH